MKRQGENRVSLREWQGLSDNAANHIAGGFDNRSGVRVTGGRVCAVGELLCCNAPSRLSK